MTNASPSLIVVDSNVLVYATNINEERRGSVANALLVKLESTDRAVVNSQILIEYFSNALRPPSELSHAEAAQWVERWLSVFIFRPVTAAVFREAVRASVAHQMNIFDAQIWAAAKLAGADFILTEDIQSTPVIEGVQYINPFDPDFDPESIGL